MAFKPAYDGGGYVLRIRELDGQPRNCTPDLVLPNGSIEECDLLERRVAENVDGGAKELTTRKFDIRSLLLKPAANIVAAKTTRHQSRAAT